MPYPPNISRHDLKRAGIIDTRIECPECKELVGEIDDHAEDCMNPVDHETLAEIEHERQAPSYDPVEDR